MPTFNEFINNLIAYNLSIAQGAGTPLFESTPYDGKDLADLITKSGDKTNPKIVAAMEMVQGYKRAHAMQIRTPKDYATNQTKIAKLQEQYYKKTVLPDFNAASGSK